MMKESTKQKTASGCKNPWNRCQGNITRLDNALAGVPDKLEKAKEQLSNLYNQQEATKSELGIRSMGAYLRKMALDGYCINLDLQDMKEVLVRLAPIQ